MFEIAFSLHSITFF